MRIFVPFSPEQFSGCSLNTWSGVWFWVSHSDLCQLYRVMHPTVPILHTGILTTCWRCKKDDSELAHLSIQGIKLKFFRNWPFSTLVPLPHTMAPRKTNKAVCSCTLLPYSTCVNRREMVLLWSRCSKRWPDSMPCSMTMLFYTRALS